MMVLVLVVVMMMIIVSWRINKIASIKSRSNVHDLEVLKKYFDVI